MKEHEYDWSTARPGPLEPSQPGKERITIRLDRDVLDWFRDQVDAAGGGNYQTLINQALREYVEGQRLAPQITAAVRQAVREELAEYRAQE